MAGYLHSLRQVGLEDFLYFQGEDIKDFGYDYGKKCDEIGENVNMIEDYHVDGELFKD